MAASSSPQKSSEISSFAKGYLVSYNVVQASGWGLILINTIRYICENYATIGFSKGAPNLYAAVERELLIFQSLATLEIFNSAVGLVRSNIVTNIMQVFSRLFILWGIIYSVDTVEVSFGLVLALVAWSITEVIRYSFYAFGLISSTPYIITWLRYTLFYVLYPIGVLGELILAFTALPIVKANGQFSVSLPNRLNFGFSYYSVIVLVILMYIPSFPQLYGHMITQRAKVIGGKAKRE